MSGVPQQDSNESSALERVARQLASLGSETPTERQVKRIVPWAVSLIIHGGIVFLAIFITWTVAQRSKPDESVLIVADFNALQYEPVASPQTSEAAPAAPAVLDLARPVPPADQIIDQMRDPSADPMSLLGETSRSSAEAASAFSQLAPQGNAQAVTFAGVTGSNARSIVYAIDASGSMIAQFQIIIDELARSLANLSPQQSYAVIFFQGSSAIEVPPAGRLIAADPQERDREIKWIKDHVIPKGGTNPLAAIERALKYHPDVVFLLSQDITGYGQFEIDQRDLLARLDELNPIDPATTRRRTQINCIQFLDVDPLATMQAIAKEHGGPGGYKFLSRQELGLGIP